ncbi:MAG: mycothiol system anti-sigma-R factor [Actinomycetota bacterium]|nr:mycothiol system anti-sigma-R factor [Actinomycetota bacterium]
MSCGDPHETDCREVLAQLWLFLDNECNQERRELLQRHLDECGPCLAELGLDEHLKALLARKCRGEHAPDALKQRLRQSIRDIMIRQSTMSVEVSVERKSDGTVVEVSTSSESRVWLSNER